MSYEVRLPVFEGPLHLLLQLIRTQKLEITDIPIASVTEQYLEYLALMEEMNLDVAGEFLVMAATLMEIKSRMLLPRPPRDVVDEGPDPREELIRKLLEYEQYQHVAQTLRRMEDDARRSFPRAFAEETPGAPLEELAPADLLTALHRMLTEVDGGNGKKAPVLRVRREAISLRQRVAEIWRMVAEEREPVPFSRLLPPGKRTRAQIVVTFMAILELLRDGRISAWQRGGVGEILLAAAGEATS
jgi:segregation and condensation protein A